MRVWNASLSHGCTHLCKNNRGSCPRPPRAGWPRGLPLSVRPPPVPSWLPFQDLRGSPQRWGQHSAPLRPRAVMQLAQTEQISGGAQVGSGTLPLQHPHLARPRGLFQHEPGAPRPWSQLCVLSPRSRAHCRTLPTSLDSILKCVSTRDTRTEASGVSKVHMSCLGTGSACRGAV